MTQEITNWTICYGHYMAPEIAAAVIYGRRNGKRIRTSRIVEVLSDDTVLTESGSIYTLSGPASGYNTGNLGWVRRCLDAQRVEEYGVDVPGAEGAR